MATSRNATSRSAARRAGGNASRTSSAESRVTARGHRSARSAAPAAAVETTKAEKAAATRSTRAKRRGSAAEAPVEEAADVRALETEEAPAAPVATFADPDLDEAATSADLVRVYLNEIGKVALLTAADEVELAKRIEAGLYASHLLTSGNNFSALQ